MQLRMIGWASLKLNLKNISANAKQLQTKLEGCIDDERQFKTAKRSQGLMYHEEKLRLSCLLAEL